MSDTRQKNGNWLIKQNEYGKYTWEQVHAALLMDIRDELQSMNRILHCSNFLDIPHVLRQISRHVAKPKRKKKKVSA